MGIPSYGKLVELGINLAQEIKRHKKSRDTREREKAAMRMDAQHLMSGQDMEMEGMETLVKMREGYVTKMRECFGESIIRRTRRSKNNEGKLISGLKERVIVDFTLKMSEQEADAFKRIITETRESM